jgi:hypothetical protein
MAVRARGPLPFFTALGFGLLIGGIIEKNDLLKPQLKCDFDASILQ